MIGLLTIGLIGLALCKKKRGVSGIGYRAFGGNSGYDGYSMSVRARNARADGRYPKTDFKREYKINDVTLEVLKDLGIISNNEWHHTSKFGNKTKFYYWLDDEDFDNIYKPNRTEIQRLAKQGDYSKIADIFNVEYNSYGTDDVRVGDIVYSINSGGTRFDGEVVSITPNNIHVQISERIGSDTIIYTSIIDRYGFSKWWNVI